VHPGHGGPTFSRALRSSWAAAWIWEARTSEGNGLQGLVAGVGHDAPHALRDALLRHDRRARLLGVGQVRACQGCGKRENSRGGEKSMRERERVREKGREEGGGGPGHIKKANELEIYSAFVPGLTGVCSGLTPANVRL